MEMGMNTRPNSELFESVMALDLTPGQRRAWIRSIARLESTGTMEDGAAADFEERRSAVTAELQAAVEAGDWKQAHRLGRKLVDLHGSIPARPPRRERPRCTAMTKKGEPCKMAAYWAPGDPAPRNGKCRIHGGLSTGPKTPEGKAAVSRAVSASNRRRAKGKAT